jgi:hypothetical protein
VITKGNKHNKQVFIPMDKKCYCKPMYEQAPNPTELNDKIKVNEQLDMIFANNGINMPFYYINNSDRYSIEEKDFLTEWCKTWNNSMKYKLDELPDFHVSYVFSCLLALYDQTGVLEYPRPMTTAEESTEKIYMPLVKDFCKKLNDQVQGMVTEKEQQKQDDFDSFMNNEQEQETQEIV